MSMPIPVTPFLVPTVCPWCQSSAIVTASKIPSDESYWRCKDCEDIWNYSRCDHRDVRPAYRNFR
jgi:predicted Zn finger-like uncharacterized protein